MFGLYGVVGRVTVMVLLAFAMRLACGGIVPVGCPSMWADAMGGECYCGNLLWQSCRTFCVSHVGKPWGSPCYVRVASARGEPVSCPCREI